ncbi:MAG TPA: hypothetical protein VJ914_25070 [Pseudonocardiaceae bacterium]|nr:hypothetical protein [Pseudonocardiaceae bacterium]
MSYPSGAPFAELIIAQGREEDRTELIDQYLPELVDRALDSSEIVDGRRAAKLNRTELRNRVLGARVDVVAPANTRLNQLIDAQRGLNSAVRETELKRTGPQRVRLPQWLRRGPGHLVIAAIGGIVPGGAFAVLMVLTGSAYPWLYPTMFGAMTGIVTWIVTDAEFGVVDMDEVRSEAERALRSWQTTVIEEGILPSLRRLINERLDEGRPTSTQPPGEQQEEIPEPPWNTITLADAPGLNWTRMYAFVPTNSTERFDQIMRQIPAGAIGIAGPRGVGKTALIEHHTNGASGQVTVRVSAPVHYEAREFVLYLYAELCRATIDRLALRREPIPWAIRRPAAGRYLVLILLAVVVAGLLAMPVVGPGILFGSPTALVATMGDPWLIPAYVALLLALLALMGLLRTVAPWLVRAVRWLAGKTTRRVDPKVTIALELAEQRLRRIRLLQTRTTGWSGKLTVPMRGEVGFTSSVQHAQQPLTYPEIVAELREFIGRVGEATNSLPVVVAIDELDKIDNAEQAQQLVNEIKGLFGADHGQFLVSVSDDALASFERGGSAPIRDAFDSAFDEIIRIDHLNIDASVRICHSKVIGVPPPFVCLAHCFAGGLARDLIRALRSIWAMSLGTERRLEEICVGLISADLDRKAHGLGTAMDRLDNTTAATEFIVTLRGLRADVSTLLAVLPTLAPDSDPDSAPELSRLRWQAATYVYHCATLLEVFTPDRMTKQNVDRRRQNLTTHPGSFDALALAKRELGAHPLLAWRRVDEFRADWGLSKAPGHL